VLGFLAITGGAVALAVAPGGLQSGHTIRLRPLRRGHFAGRIANTDQHVTGRKHPGSLPDMNRRRRFFGQILRQSESTVVVNPWAAHAIDAGVFRQPVWGLDGNRLILRE
jgi:hypothetical protein